MAGWLNRTFLNPSLIFILLFTNTGTLPSVLRVRVMATNATLLREFEESLRFFAGGKFGL